MSEETSGSLIPYTCIFIDAGLKDLSTAAMQCVNTDHDRRGMIQQLQNIWTTPANPNPVLPLLSVRSGFDLFFRVMNFPPGSEIIMSAMNIPDMVRIVKHHNLHIVPLDISIDTAAPKVELLPQLVSPRTVAIVIAHLYGKWSPMDEVIDFAKKHNLYVIEDCAESFCGFDKLSHKETDLALFSFGVIKFYTSFGGAIAKIKPQLYKKMLALYDTYPIQSQAQYLTKILKYVILYFVLNVTTINKNIIQFVQSLGISDYKDRTVKLLRGFPNNMVQRIRERPSGALLSTMLIRQKSFSSAEFYLQRLKGEYLACRLPPSLEVVGHKSSVNNYWLFPVLAENPDNLMYLLNALGVDAYRGATQLNIVEPANGNPNPLMNPKPHHMHTENESHLQRSLDGDDNRLHPHRSLDRGSQDHIPAVNKLTSPVGDDRSKDHAPTADKQYECLDGDSGLSNYVPTVNRQYPHEAKYLVDHVLYLPVNKLVPFHALNRMARAIRTAVNLDKSASDGKVKVVAPSKL